MAKRQKLTITKYVLPGTYVGQVYRPHVVNLGMFPRIMCYIGRGVPYIVKENMEIIRGFVYNEKCNFPTVGPYISVLNHASTGSQLTIWDNAKIKLYNQNGEEVSTKDWKFVKSNPSGLWDEVEISSKAFKPSDTYFIDYQSSEADIYDTLPITGTRQILSAGDHQDENSYEEHTDFENVTVLGSPVGDPTNSEYPLIYTVDKSQGVAANLTIIPPDPVTPANGTVFTGPIPAKYTLTVSNFVPMDLTATPAIPATTFKLNWVDDSSPAKSGEIDVSTTSTSINSLPLMDGIVSTLTNVNQLANGQVFTIHVKQTLIRLNSAAKYVGPDRNYFLTVEGNQLTQVPYFQVSPNPGSITVNSDAMVAADGSSLYTGVTPIKYTLTVANKVIVNASLTTFNLNWVDNAATPHSGVIAVSAALNDIDVVLAPLGGISIHIDNVAGLSNGNVFTIDVQQTHRVYISWYSDDYVSASGILDIVANGDVYDKLLESGVRLDFLNIQGLVAGDKWSIKATNTNEISWNFSRLATKDFTPADIYYDVMGLVTGTPRTYYITLDNTPVPSTNPLVPTVTLVRTDTNQAIPHTDIPYTPYVKLNITTPLLVNFRATYHFHNAPTPGQKYFVSATYTRPKEMYNEVRIYSDYQTALAEIGYPSAENHLAIMLDYAMNVANNDFVSICQVFDADHDGVYNRADYSVALQATQRNKEVTDICVLSKFETLADQMSQSQYCNDPLIGALRLYYIGYPIGYPIGTPATSGTIANTSLSVLQVQGANPAHGTFISCGNDWVKRTVILQTGNPVQLTLDGSFFAGMVGAINNSFRDPNTLLNNQVIPGIDDIRSYTDTQMEILGASSNTFANIPHGSNVAKIIDAVTTDFVSDDYHEVNVMCVKQLVAKRIIRAGNAAVIGYVPRNTDDGVSFIRSIMARELTGMVGDGIIADYSDASGRPRDLRPESDIDVWRDENDKTRWNFTYWFNARYGIKRLTGMYSVDENAFL
jgi:hypothetical protein